MQQNDLWRAVRTFPKKIVCDEFQADPTQRVTLCPVDQLSVEVRAWFADRGLELTPSFLLFGFHEPIKAAIHDDLTDRGKVDCSINVELSGKSCLRFFEPSNAVTTQFLHGVHFSRYKPSSMTELGCLHFDDQAYLVRTGLPHQAQGLVTPRILATIRFNRPDSETLLSWKEAVSALADDLSE
jgi:hypothetical protein